MIFKSLSQKATSYVNGTICRVVNHKEGLDDIFYCNGREDSITLSDGKNKPVITISKNTDLVKYDFRTPMLGYLQFDTGAVFTWRNPIRQSKVGLTSRNTSPAHVFNEDITTLIKALREVNMGLYKNEREARDFKGLVALSSNYAISFHNNTLHYSGKKLGTFGRDLNLAVSSQSEAVYHNDLLPSLTEVRCVFNGNKVSDPFNEDY